VSARLSREDGFTVVELLVAMVVGVVVLGAAFQLVQIATGLTTATQDRVDAAQRGRAGLEAVTTQLRSMVCVTNGAAKEGPLVSAAADRVEYYANTRTPDTPPDLRVLSYDSTLHRLSLRSTPGRRPANGLPVGAVVLPYDALTSRTRAMLDDVYPIDASTPIFRFKTYDAAGLRNKTLDEVDLGDPVPTADLTRMLWVEVNFRVRPTGAKASTAKDAVMKGKAYFRVADPNKLTADENPSNGITC
jgi:prepilin-type N-terminal cleavage/methylation domain-containing protein